ncbi:AMP-binding protein [Nocardia yamanashiensis]|uniref:AMP-binding protein n=1 Tax=Nocardia yamanashiensis TaxID=209247 RepID=UPI001E4C4356|nr:AMP-binding protein [Nocardia yamanashiensis]UGT38954.1 AMP-binding protein [Nocardia yamanashiensis]
MAEPIPLGRLLTELAARSPAAAAITDARGTWTRAELEAAANRLARAYRELGVRAGDLVTVALPNGAEFYTALFALWKLGAVPQPISALLPAPEREAVLALAGPVLVVGVRPGDPGLPWVPAGFEPDPGTSDAALDAGIVAPAWKVPTSGGSTGRPKLIVPTQRGELDVTSTATILDQRDGDTQLVCGPLYHNAPFNFSVYGLLAGQHLVVLPKFDTVTALRAVAGHRVNWISLVPTMMIRMARELQRAPAEYDITSLRSLWHGAAPCPDWVKRAWIDLLGAPAVHEMYATTEGTMMTHIDGTEWLRRPGSVGRPLWGRVRVAGPDGADLAPGEIGEILVRPESDTPTYRYVGAEARLVDGWEVVGDLGALDADGYLYLADRRTDLIVTGGANVYPAEVEAALSEHPAVRGVVVLGLPDEDLGQRVHAIVETATALTDAELHDFTAARLARYKVPRSFDYTAAPLRDDAGKVRRASLVE